MCGIAGQITSGKISGDQVAEVESMAAAMYHRGPDAWGIHVGAHYVFGNTRLRVTDLTEAGDLPISDVDAGLTLAYNGEITNFVELRTELRQMGYFFNSQSDSEVLLRAYQAWGIDCLARLSGQFAFALYDQREQAAYIVRDFFGMRPIFVMQNKQDWYFASEIKAFLTLPCCSPDLDMTGLHHYFSLAYYPCHHTPFASIRELDGGHYMKIDLHTGIATTTEYYKISYEPDHTVSQADATEKLRAAMVDSVSRNLRADAGVGLALSGGVDSSSILASAHHLGVASQIHSYSIEMDEASYNEAKYQDIIVRHTQPVHTRVPVSQQGVVDNFERHIAYIDEPLADGSLIPLFMLSRVAQPDIKVLLSGEGGDEVFNAYETHMAYKLRKLYRKLAPAGLRKPLRAMVSHLPTRHRKLSFDFVAKRFTEGVELGIPESHMYWRHVLEEKQKLALMPWSNAEAPTHELFRSMYDADTAENELDRLSTLDLKLYFIGDLMVCNDRMAAAHSLESRFPWVDRILFDTVRTLPADMRFPGLRSRHLQKQAMKPYLPRAIYRRGNMGLEMPHSSWFGKELSAMLQHYLAPELLQQAGVFDPKIVARMREDHLQRRIDHGRALWAIMHFTAWFNMFVHDRSWKQHLQQFSAPPRYSYDADAYRTTAP